MEEVKEGGQGKKSKARVEQGNKYNGRKINEQRTVRRLGKQNLG